ncbi:MAG: ribonuclease T2 family protein [Terriglobales bacterium]
MAASRTVVFFTIACSLILAPDSSGEQHGGQPGVFDYYVLTLSWSPEFCYQHSYSPECRSGHHGFIVHGLWPQFTRGYPENCSESPGLANPSEMLDIMPDQRLVEHEWSTHGTCSGSSAREYFKLLRRAYASIKIPSRLAAPSEGFSIEPDELKREFLEANPNLGRDAIAVSCGHNYLTGVHICLTKDLQPTACSDLRDCRANTIRVTPER